MKIKKLTYSLMIALLLSCSAEEQPAGEPVGRDGLPVGFTASVPEAYRGQTRAPEDYRGRGVWTTEALRTAGFGVYCWYTGSSDFTVPTASTYMLMRNQQVEYENGQWGYTPTKYWPSDPDEKLTFRAYAPYTNYLLTDDNGKPLLPVVVRADDYCNNRQQDPLWGTSIYVNGEKSTNDEKSYGEPYDNFTYHQSGSELTADERDGIIDWYFHHGMAMFALQVQLAEETEGVAVRLTRLHTGPFYDKGLLDIHASQTANSSQKPLWQDRSGDIYVDLAYQHPDDPDDPDGSKHDDLIGVPLSKENYTSVAVNGLLVIPRDYTSSETKMLLEVTYEEYNPSTGVVLATKTARTNIDRNIQGNTVYWLQLMLNAEENTLYVRSFINLDWQTGTYDLIDGL